TTTNGPYTFSLTDFQEEAMKAVFAGLIILGLPVLALTGTGKEKARVILEGNFDSKLARHFPILKPAEPGVEPKYRVSFASFAPLNLDVYLADADGSNARPLLPHPGQDYNASFSSDGRWVLFTSTRGGVA